MCAVIGVHSGLSRSSASSMDIPITSLALRLTAARPAPSVDMICNCRSVVHRMAGICSTTMRRYVSRMFRVSRAFLLGVMSRRMRVVRGWVALTVSSTKISWPSLRFPTHSLPDLGRPPGKTTSSGRPINSVSA